jgi:hypothetical protein
MRRSQKTATGSSSGSPRGLPPRAIGPAASAAAWRYCPREEAVRRPIRWSWRRRSHGHRSYRGKMLERCGCRLRCRLKWPKSHRRRRRMAGRWMRCSPLWRCPAGIPTSRPRSASSRPWWIGGSGRFPSLPRRNTPGTVTPRPGRFLSSRAEPLQARLQPLYRFCRFCQLWMPIHLMESVNA